MKKIPWRFYIALFFTAGVTIGIMVSSASRAAHQSPIIGILASVSTAFLFVLLITLTYRRAMQKRDPSFTLADASARCNATFSLPVSTDDAFDLCTAALAYLPGFYAQKSSKAELKIDGITGGASMGYIAFGSPGERITVSIKSRGPSQSEAFVESKPGTLFIVLDYGKNRENLNTISKRINEQIKHRFEAQREATAHAEMQRALTEAKLSALEAHIEPHFLYNTLANAQVLTRTDPARADEMLGNLITYLRSSLPQCDGAGSTFGSTLGREIERSTAYLEILKIRMGARLNISVDLPESLTGRGFPAMMVQTLVENAIKHGIEPKLSGGTILIEATQHDGWLKVKVTDDGLGLCENTSGTGMGIKNIRDRLKLSFDNQATFSLAPHLPNGMAATIAIPLSHYQPEQK